MKETDAMGTFKTILQGYGRLLNGLEKVINFFLVLSLTTMVGCVLIGVAFRNASLSITWINELAQFSCVWAIYIGLGLGIRYKMLAGVDIIGTLMPPLGRKCMVVAQNVLIIFFLLVFVLSSYPLMNLFYTSGRLSPEMRVPIIFGYLGPVLGSSFALLYALEVFVRDLLDIPAGRKEE